MVETNYGKCGHILVNWGFRKKYQIQVSISPTVSFPKGESLVRSDETEPFVLPW